MTKPLKILHINDRDEGGGAANVARNLHLSALENDMQSVLAVGVKKTDLPGVIQIPRPETRWRRGSLKLRERLLPFEHKVPGLWRITAFLNRWQMPQRQWENIRGCENFYAPGSKKLLSMISFTPSLIHCFNLHGRYFDLRLLPKLSKTAPVLLSLVDPWYFSGHCAHPFECKKWQVGCGECPHLETYPRVSKDNTARNWRLKQKIYQNSTIYTVGCCDWVHQNMKRSMLGESVRGSSVIKIGVQTDIFKPGDKLAIRKKLGLPPDANILLFAASTIKENPWKDFETMRKAISIIGEKTLSKQVVFVALGDDAPEMREGHAKIVFVPYKTSPADVAEFFQAADIYLHAARADTFPVVNMEAMACGIPVIGTAIGGIVEQIKGCESIIDQKTLGLNIHPASEATGLLVPVGSYREMAAGILSLLKNEKLRKTMGENARKLVEEQYTESHYHQQYFDLYRNITG